MKGKILAIALLLSTVALSGFGCKTVSKEVQEKMKAITLKYWRVWDGPDDFKSMIAQYNAVHTNITIQYRKLNYDEYEEELINALAEDRGPDILSINSTWVKRYQSKLAYAPDAITMAYPVVKGTLKKEVIPELRTKKSITVSDLKSGFVAAVYDDVVLPYYDGQTKANVNKIYALPLGMDTLVTYYNKDLLDNAGIAELPEYWNKDFQKAVKKLTKQNARGEILQAGVALGGGANIENSSDILAALILQSGSAVISDQGKVVFRQFVKEVNDNPGLNAIRFYNDFANPTKDVYSWNKTLPNSQEMFIQGKLAIMFGYAYQEPIIRAQAPKLNFAVKPFLQIEDAAVKNVLDYWVEAVSKKSKYKSEAWDFVQYITVNPEVAKLYLTSTGKISPMRSIINGQLKDEKLSVFAKDVLVAENWYHGNSYDKADKAMQEMVDAIADNPDNLDYEVRIAEGKIANTLSEE